MYLSKTKANLGRVIIASITLIVTTVVNADQEVHCPKTGCDFTVEAEVVDELVLQLQVSNKSTEPLEFLYSHFEPGLLRLLVVNKFGDLVERFSWIGDSSKTTFVVEPNKTFAVDVELSRWYENIEQKIESECFDLFWNVHAYTLEDRKPHFFGGAMQLSCHH